MAETATDALRPGDESPVRTVDDPCFECGYFEVYDWRSKKAPYRYGVVCVHCDSSAMADTLEEARAKWTRESGRALSGGKEEGNG